MTHTRSDVLSITAVASNGTGLYDCYFRNQSKIPSSCSTDRMTIGSVLPLKRQNLARPPSGAINYLSNLDHKADCHQCGPLDAELDKVGLPLLREHEIMVSQKDRFAVSIHESARRI